MRRFLLVGVAMCLVVAACGDGSSPASSDAPTATSQPTTSTTDTVTPTTEPGVQAAAAFAPTDGLVRAPIASAPVEEFVAATNNSGFELIRSEQDAGNLVLSPTSIVHAILMARGAADDATRTAISDGLGITAGFSAHDAWNALAIALDDAAETETAMDETPSPIVRLADRIWPSLSATPDQEWIDLLATHHVADVQPIDVNEPEASRSLINDWVSEQTEGLIPDLLPPNFISPQTVLVLTDTIYFKAQWLTVFGKYGEVEQPFHSLDGSQTDATFMVERELAAPRGVFDGYASAELPYLGGDFSMLVIVPDQGRFDSVLGNLNQDFLANLDEQMEPGPYELLLPKWKTTSSLDLSRYLIELGAMPGSYPGIGPGVFLDAAVHGADIAVDEIGTVAAAATALGFNESGPADPEFTIAADRPFLYVIRHNETGLVLFVGQVHNLEG